MTSIHSRETIYHCKKRRAIIKCIIFHLLLNSLYAFVSQFTVFILNSTSKLLLWGCLEIEDHHYTTGFLSTNGRDKLKSALWNCFFSWTIRKNKSLVCFSKKSFSQCVDWSRYLQIWISCQNQNSSLLVHSLIIFINDAYIIQNFILKVNTSWSFGQKLS